LGLFNNTEETRYQNTQTQLTSLLTQINITQNLSSEIIAQLDYSGKNTTLYEDILSLYSQNNQILILVQEINLTTHNISTTLQDQIIPKLNSIISDTTNILAKWGSLTANDIYQQTLVIDTEINNTQAWLELFNETQDQRYQDIADELNITLTEAIRAELGFSGQSITAYQYFVQLDNKLSAVNTSLYIKIATEGNLTREQLLSTINSNVSKLLTEIDANEAKLNLLITKWGTYSATSMMEVINNNTDTVITLEAWIEEYLVDNGSAAVLNYLQNVVFPEINDSEELATQIITILGYTGINSTVYEDIQALNTQNQYITTLVEEINFTTHTLDSKFDIFNATMNLIYNDTQELIDNWGNYSMSQIWTKLDNIEDYVLDINLSYNFDCANNSCNITVDNTNVLQAVNNVRSELGFQGTGFSAYEYLVNLYAELVMVQYNLENKIDTRFLNTSDVISAIQSNTTSILNEINSNQEDIASILSKWGNDTADSIINNITDVRNRVINLDSWLNLFNETENQRHNETKTAVQNVMDWLGLFNSTENTRHNNTVNAINNAITEVIKAENISNNIIALLGYNGTNTTAYDRTLDIMNMLAEVVATVGNLTGVDYVDLYNGSNAIALPAQPTNISIEYVTQNITGMFERVDHYDSATSSWKVYVPGGFGNTLANMTQNKVYWIYLNISSTRFYIK
jgi:uncharacterized coiled-coil protein SlyX